MRIVLKRHVFGIMVISIGRCDCDQDCCLVCEIKFRIGYAIRKVTK